MALPKKDETVPMGRELDWSEEEMDLMLAVNPSDIQQARQLVEESVPEPFKDILEAEDDENDEPA